MKQIIHTFIIFSLALMLGLALVSIFKPDLLLPLIEWIKSQIELLGKWNYLLAFISSLGESLPIIGTLIPGQIILVSVGGFYGGLGGTQFVGVTAAAIFGSILSNWIGYILGKKYGESFFESYGMWVGIEQTELKYLKKGVDTWGPIGILGSKFHAHLRAFLPFIAGSMGFIAKKFWIFNVIASTLWAILFVVIGIFFAQYYEIILEYIRYMVLGIMGFGIWYIWKYKKKEFQQYMYEKNIEVNKKIAQKK